MNPLVNRGEHERGAILVQAAFTILVLIALTAFVVDYGVLQVARGQSQNAADAGALAGAIARSFDDFTNNPPLAGGLAEQSALKATRCALGSSSCLTAAPLPNFWTGSLIWPSDGKDSTVHVSWDCPPGFTGRCARVDVYRDNEVTKDGLPNGSKELPTFFGNIMNVTKQRVKATASARVAAANATNCMRPFALPDKWIDNVNAGTFDHWNADGTSKNPYDLYIPPTQSNFTGYRFPDNVGDLLTLIPDTNPNAASLGGQGWSLLIDLPDGNGGWLTGNSNTATIATCVGQIVKRGQYVPTENGGTGQINHYTDELIAQDPNATWDSQNKKVISGCAPGICPTVGFQPVSPRIVPIAVFDLDEFQRRKILSDRGPCIAAGFGGQCIKIVNIIGFYVLDLPTSGSVRGYLTSDPGIFVTGPPAIDNAASFLNFIQLVR
jgi:hypothetical protein